MKLRDEYASLDELCEDMGINRNELCKRLKDSGFEYDENAKKFW